MSQINIDLSAEKCLIHQVRFPRRYSSQQSERGLANYRWFQPVFQVLFSLDLDAPGRKKVLLEGFTDDNGDRA